MSTNLRIPVTRDGQSLKLEFEQCTRGELTNYFGSLSLEDLRPWVYLLVGYACGSAQKIAELERHIAGYDP